MKKLSARLTLNRETLRLLNPEEAGRVEGGAIQPTQFNSCGGGDTCFCSRFRCTVGSICCP